MKSPEENCQKGLLYPDSVGVWDCVDFHLRSKLLLDAIFVDGEILLRGRSSGFVFPRGYFANANDVLFFKTEFERISDNETP